jgi:hypothetical protein
MGQARRQKKFFQSDKKSKNRKRFFDFLSLYKILFAAAGGDSTYETASFLRPGGGAAELKMERNLIYTVFNVSYSAATAAVVNFKEAHVFEKLLRNFSKTCASKEFYSPPKAATGLLRQPPL